MKAVSAEDYTNQFIKQSLKARYLTEVFPSFNFHINHKMKIKCVVRKQSYVKMAETDQQFEKRLCSKGTFFPPLTA